MKQTSKKFQLVKAKKAFQQDLQNDPDFIEYKKNSISAHHSYGVLIAGNAKFLLEVFVSSQSLVYRQTP